MGASYQSSGPEEEVKSWGVRGPNREKENYLRWDVFEIV
jgi:hypothetical protein